MPIYKRLPTARKKAFQLPFYRPIDRLFIRLWGMRKMLAPFLIAAAAVLAVYAGLTLYTNNYQSSASRLFNQGELQKTVREYPRSKSAVLARMKLGRKATDDKNYDEAIQWYTPVFENSRHPSILRISALHNLALVLGKKGEWDRVISTLERAMNDPSNLDPDYSRLLIGRAYEVKGDRDKARETYRSLSEGASASAIKEEAKERLEWLD